MPGCEEIDAVSSSEMHTASQGFTLTAPSPGCSGIPGRASSRCPGAQKNTCGACGRVQQTFYDRKIRRVRDLSCGDTRVFLDLEVRRVGCSRCGKVKQEKLGFLAELPFYTRRFAFYVGRRCRASTITDIAHELHLHWHTVKELEKQYMREQLRRAGSPGPRVIGIDEISIKKGHTTASR